jgi:hypothetical protein
MQARFSTLAVEFAHHLPYTIISSLIAMGAVWYFGVTELPKLTAAGTSPWEWSFHILHPMHLALSAIATTSVFWRHERRLLKALVVGFFGTIIPCGLSDYIFPFIGGRLLGQSLALHICLLEEPLLVLPFAVLGVLGGLLVEERLSGSSVFSHGAHVFVSSLASLLYLVSFGFTAWLMDIHLLFPVFLVVVIAVWIPCCISDIVVPVSAVHEHGRDRAVLRPSV